MSPDRVSYAFQLVALFPPLYSVFFLYVLFFSLGRNENIVLFFGRKMILSFSFAQVTCCSLKLLGCLCTGTEDHPVVKKKKKDTKKLGDELVSTKPKHDNRQKQATNWARTITHTPSN